jgi:transcriptional regulator with XRE-family HTH domain
MSKLFSKLQDPEYRKSFVGSQIRIGIPFQIRALMKQRGWTQEGLAEKTGIAQPSISNLLKPSGSQPNIKTLVRIAEAFDCGLAVRFVPFSELTKWSEEFDPTSFHVSEFSEDKPIIRTAENSTTSYSKPGPLEVMGSKLLSEQWLQTPLEYRFLSRENSQSSASQQRDKAA